MQFTHIKRNLKAGLTENVNVSGSFMYLVTASELLEVELYDRINGKVSQVILSEGMTWAEDPKINNSFTSLKVLSKIDHKIEFLAGFGRVANENAVITTSPEHPLDVKVVESAENPINVKVISNVNPPDPTPTEPSGPAVNLNFVRKNFTVASGIFKNIPDTEGNSWIMELYDPFPYDLQFSVGGVSSTISVSANSNTKYKGTGTAKVKYYLSGQSNPNSWSTYVDIFIEST